MSERRRHVLATVAGLGAFIVVELPLLLMWLQGSSGSIGNLNELGFLGGWMVFSIGVGVLAGWLMNRALMLPEPRREIGRYDPWAAYFVGLSVLTLGLTAVPGVGLLILLPDENKPLGSRVGLFTALWIFGTLATVILAAFAARWVLGRRFKRDRSRVAAADA